MEYLPRLQIYSDDEVYPPSEDSILLIESLNVVKNEKVLEIGCGSGVVSIHCAKNGAIVTCGDINPRAVELTKKNAEANGVDLKVVSTDIYSGIEGRFHTIIFNLPYLPVQDEGELAKAWSGGEGGMGPFPELIEQAPEHLLPEGRVVVVGSTLMDTDKVTEIVKGLNVTVIGKLPLFFEKLYVLEIRF